MAKPQGLSGASLPLAKTEGKTSLAPKKTIHFTIHAAKGVFLVIPLKE